MALAAWSASFLSGVECGAQEETAAEPPARVQAWHAIFTPELKEDLDTTIPGALDAFLGKAGKWRELSDAQAQALVAPLRVRSPALFPFWKDLLRDEHPSVRTLVFNYVAPLNEKAFAPEFAALLNDPNPQIRGQALGALSRIPCPETGREVLAVLGGLSPEAKRQALPFLLPCREEALRKPAETLRADSADPAAQAYGLIYLVHLDGEKRRDEVQAALSGDSEELRHAAVYLAGENRWESCVPGLIRVVEKIETPPRTRSAAIFALEFLDAREAAPAIAGCLDYRNLEIRLQALQALARLADGKTVAPLLKALESRVQGGAAVLVAQRTPEDEREEKELQRRNPFGGAAVRQQPDAAAQFGWTATAYKTTRRLCVQALEKAAGLKMPGATWEAKAKAWREWETKREGEKAE